MFTVSTLQLNILYNIMKVDVNDVIPQNNFIF